MAGRGGHGAASGEPTDIVRRPASAAPRPPQPPWPEPTLSSWRFDDTNSAPAAFGEAQIAHNLRLVESWSGYALWIAGDEPRALVTPAVRTNGQAIFAPGTGSVRLWFAPAWASASSGGTGPGAWARLCEVSHGLGTRREYWLALVVDPSGNTLSLAISRSGEVTGYLQAPLQ